MNGGFTLIARGGKHDGEVIHVDRPAIFNFPSGHKIARKYGVDTYVWTGEYDEQGRRIYIPQDEYYAGRPQ